MHKKLLIAVLSIAILSLSGLSFAEDVYVTKYGKKYHKENSRFIKNKEVEKLTREEAEELGYKPSSDFLKDDEKAEAKDEKETKEAKK